MFEFRLKFHWCLIPGSNWQSSSIGSVNGLATGVKAIVWTNDGYQVYRRIYASLGLFGLTRLYWDWLSQFFLHMHLLYFESYLFIVCLNTIWEAIKIFWIWIIIIKIPQTIDCVLLIIFSSPLQCFENVINSLLDIVAQVKKFNVTHMANTTIGYVMVDIFRLIELCRLHNKSTVRVDGAAGVNDYTLRQWLYDWDRCLVQCTPNESRGTGWPDWSRLCRLRVGYG